MRPPRAEGPGVKSPKKQASMQNRITVLKKVESGSGSVIFRVNIHPDLQFGFKARSWIQIRLDLGSNPDTDLGLTMWSDPDLGTV